MRKILVFTAALVLLSTAPALAAGQYTHITTDENYLVDGVVVLDPYAVGEGSGASHAAVLYWGVFNGDTHHSLATQGWPYTRTLAVIGVAFPCIPNRYCFDHDAAARLLASGLTWSALDALYEQR